MDMFSKNKPQSIMPEAGYLAELKVAMNETYNQNSKRKFGISTLIKYPVTGLAFSLILFVLIGTVGYQFLNPKGTGLSADEQKAILASISQNNSIASGVGINKNLSSANESSNQPMIVQQRIDWAGAVNSSYSYYRQDTQVGPKLDQCKGMGDAWPYGSVVTEGHTYYDQGGNAYSLTKTFDSQGRLLEYSLFRDDYSIDYKGGDYAMKIIYPQIPINTREVGLEPVALDGGEPTVSEPVSEMYAEPTNSKPITDEPYPDVTEYPVNPAPDFGPDAVVEKIVKDGQAYYVVTYKDAYACSGVVVYDLLDKSGLSKFSGNKDERVAYVRQWVLPDSFEIIKYETFLDVVDPSNLVMSTTYKNQYKDIDFAEVQAVFTYDLDVELREVRMPDYLEYGTPEYLQKVRDLIFEYQLSVLLPTATEFEIASFDSNVWSAQQQSVYDYQKDRNFYSPGVVGDKQFVIFNPSGELPNVNKYVMPIVSYYFNTPEYFASSDYEMAQESKSVTFNLYESNVSDLDILKSEFGDDYQSRVLQGIFKPIRVAGEVVNAEYYEIGWSSGVAEGSVDDVNTSNPISPADCMGTGCANSDRVLVIDFKNFIYLMRFSADQSTSIDDYLDFDEIDYANAGDVDRFVELLKDAFTSNNQLPLRSEPSSGDATSSSLGQ